MYRQAGLRLPSVACGVEQALARMELSPRGGHWCWRCRLTAQIAEHAPRGIDAPWWRVTKAPRPMPLELRGALIALGALVGVLVFGQALLSLFAALLPRC